MTDRELLELAAKAAGMEYPNGQTYCEVHGVWGMLEKRPYQWWNPLASDGDALRLAVKLEMTIDFCEGKIWHNRIEIDFGGGGDQNEHARRAIVRAAADIGKELP